MNAAERSQSKQQRAENPQVLSSTHDYGQLTDVANQHPSIQEISVDSKQRFSQLLQRIETQQNAVALFLKSEKGALTFINKMEDLDVEPGSELAYLGKTIDVENLNGPGVQKESDLATS